MNHFDTKRIATNGLLLLLSLFVLFHLLIILRIVPFEMVWGGRLKDVSQMLRFEAISIAMNLLMLTIVSVHAGILKLKINPLVLTIAFWAMFVLFLLNTAGNLASTNELERLLFTPVTLLLAVFSLCLALSKKQENIA